MKRFLFDENGPTAVLEIDCLQQKFGTSHNMFKENRKFTDVDGRVVGTDVATFATFNIICGSLNAVFVGGEKWEFPQYPEVKRTFEKMKKADREAMFEKARYAAQLLYFMLF